jgi:hypothetical protein
MGNRRRQASNQLKAEKNNGKGRARRPTPAAAAAKGAIQAAISSGAPIDQASLMALQQAAIQAQREVTKARALKGCEKRTQTRKEEEAARAAAKAALVAALKAPATTLDASMSESGGGRRLVDVKGGEEGMEGGVEGGKGGVGKKEGVVVVKCLGEGEGEEGVKVVVAFEGGCAPEVVGEEGAVVEHVAEPVEEAKEEEEEVVVEEKKKEVVAEPVVEAKEEDVVVEEEMKKEEEVVAEPVEEAKKEEVVVPVQEKKEEEEELVEVVVEERKEDNVETLAGKVAGMGKKAWKAFFRVLYGVYQGLRRVSVSLKEAMFGTVRS